MTYEEFCEEYHIRLNRQQAEAAQSIRGAVLLLAVPGSGKTTVLVTRLGYMIRCAGIRPESILTLTYTIAATRDMAARFRSFFGEELGERLEFRTINGVCAKVIQYYGRLIGKNPFSLVTEEKTTAGMLSAIYQKVEGGFATGSDIKNIRTLITYIKNRMLSTEEIRQLDQESDCKISEIYAAYCSELRDKRLMDYDDQMAYAYTILRKSQETLAFFQEKYPYICVDEAQDTSKIQHEIIRLLAGARDNLFMVGDEDQSIYGFRAAYPEALLSFEQDHPGAKVLLMEENFRSNAKIVAAADRFIQKNVLRHEKHMRAARPAGADIREIDLKGRSVQYRYLIKVAESCQRQTAVLYRDNESMLPLVDLLERQGIPYRIRNAELAFFTHRVVLDIRNIILFAENPTDTELFLQVYYKISTYINKESAIRICQISKEKRIPVLQAAYYYGSLPQKTKENSRIIRAELQSLLKDPAEKAVNRIMRVLGYGDYLERAGMGDGKLFVLRALARNEESPRRLVERLEELQEIIKEKPGDPRCKFILSTIHASKGLEYDTVYLMDVIDGIFPECVPDGMDAWGKPGDGRAAGRRGTDGKPGGGRNLTELFSDKRNGKASYTDPEDRFGNSEKRSAAEEKELAAYEEERRLFYVGVTRAKERLFLFSVNQKSAFIKEFMHCNEWNPRNNDNGITPAMDSNVSNRRNPGDMEFMRGTASRLEAWQKQEPGRAPGLSGDLKRRAAAELYEMQQRRRKSGLQEPPECREKPGLQASPEWGEESGLREQPEWREEPGLWGEPKQQIKPAAALHPGFGRKKAFSEEGFRAFCRELGEGLAVEHKRFGKGVIDGLEEEWVVIRFEERTRRFELKTLYENGLLNFL